MAKRRKKLKLSRKDKGIILENLETAMAGVQTPIRAQGELIKQMQDAGYSYDNSSPDGERFELLREGRKPVGVHAQEAEDPAERYVDIRVGGRLVKRSKKPILASSVLGYVDSVLNPDGKP